MGASYESRTPTKFEDMLNASKKEAVAKSRREAVRRTLRCRSLVGHGQTCYLARPTTRQGDVLLKLVIITCSSLNTIWNTCVDNMSKDNHGI